jgi:hypothetical protein
LSEKEVRTVARAGGLEGKLMSTRQDHHIAKDIAAVWGRLGKTGWENGDLERGYQTKRWRSWHGQGWYGVLDWRPRL